MTGPAFNAKRFLQEHFQNPATLIAAVKAAGQVPPSHAQAEKWFTRSSVPGDWLARLVAIRTAKRVKVDLSAYLEAGT
jgi:hypothetical protein